MFIGVLAAVWLCAVGAPMRAEAYIGQSIVEGVGGKLTSGAEKVLKTGKTVPELVTQARSFGGVPSASEAVGVLQKGRVLPALGTAILGFGAGTAVGSEICVWIGIDGCWYHGSEGADPTAPGTGKWEFLENPPQFIGEGTLPALSPFQWYYKSPAGYEINYIGTSGWVNCGYNLPSGYTRVFLTAYSLTTCKGAFGNPAGETGNYAVVMRDVMANRVLEHHATDNPAISNYGGKAPESWPEQIVDAINEGGEAGEKVGQFIAHKMEPEAISNPYALTVNVPSCDELTWGACKAALEGKELEPVRESINWDEVKTDVPAQVLTLTPPAGNNVETGSTVTVTTNPDEAGMPVLIPEPEPGETYEHYAARLNPVLEPEKVVLTDATLDPSAGPNAVVAVQPQAGSKFDPAGPKQPVSVQVNPPTAPPAAGGGGGGDCDTSIGAIDWSPLNHPLGDKFPFGVFGFFVEWVAEWEAGSGSTPAWAFTLLPEGAFGSDGIEVDVDLEFMQPVVDVGRIALLFASFVGLLWFLGTAAAKIQGDDS